MEYKWIDNTELNSWGWRQSSLISINYVTHEATYNMKFYVMKCFAHFINLNAFCVATLG